MVEKKKAWSEFIIKIILTIILYYYYLSVQAVEIPEKLLEFFLQLFVYVVFFCVFLSILGMGPTCDPISVICCSCLHLDVSTFHQPVPNLHKSRLIFSSAFLPSVLWLAECSVHGITTVCVNTAVRVSALAVPISTNMTVCPQLT